jgi:5-methylcytosine-specific restriction protein A
MPHKDPEQRREYLRLYHVKHRDKKNAFAAQWRKANPEDPEAKRLRSKLDYIANREKRTAKHKEWDANHKQDRREWLKGYWKRPEVIARDKERRQRDREKVNQQNRESYARHRATRIKSLAEGNRRRARQAGLAGGNFTQAEWNELCAHYGQRCLRCHRTAQEIKLTADHVIPLSRGGSNEISNIQPLCRPCNSAKGTKIMDFRADRLPFDIQNHIVAHVAEPARARG